MTEFTPFPAILGGIMIGLSAVILMALIGRIAGMTGIVSGILPPVDNHWLWRSVFLAGAVCGPALYLAFTGKMIEFAVPAGYPALVSSGLIVGVGVTFGSGCTSGHGVCGMARFSPRSIVATCVFMFAAFATVFVLRHIIGVQG
jgi:uncharacterized membrane protein YedE/YeeE